MLFEISADLYSRMTEIPATLDIGHPKQYLRCLFFERRNNHLYCVATNAGCAAVEYLGINAGPDEAAAITIDDGLRALCLEWAKQDVKLLFNHVEMLYWCQTSGCTVNLYHQLPSEHEFQIWRDWFPSEMPSQSFGTMYWAAHSVQALACASKSGGLRFPQYIDVRKNCIIADTDNSNWIGLLCVSQPNANNIIPVVMPDWI